MASSLQDQLKKAGLVSDKQARKAKTDKRKEHKQVRAGQGPSPDEARRQAELARAEKAERDRQLNQERQREAERKALAAQVRQMIEANRLPLETGDLPYHFVDDGKVKTLRVGPQVQKDLARGRLAVARLDGGYALLKAEVAERVAARDPAAIVLRHQSEAPKDIDDPYAGYEVPDDLLW